MRIAQKKYARSPEYSRSRGIVRPASEWFEDYTIPEPNSGCLLWFGPFGSGLKKYGSISVASGRRMLAHRWAFENFVGPIPDGLNVLHRCDNHGCVNPDHLFVGTQSENIRDCHRKGRANILVRKRGTQQHLSVLNEGIVREILINKDKLKQQDLAERYGVNRSTISAVQTRITWKHVSIEKVRA